MIIRPRHVGGKSQFLAHGRRPKALSPRNRPVPARSGAAEGSMAAPDGGSV